MSDLDMAGLLAKEAVRLKILRAFYDLADSDVVKFVNQEFPTIGRCRAKQQPH